MNEKKYYGTYRLSGTRRSAASPMGHTAVTAAAEAAEAADESAWADFFFGEEHISHTLQNLMRGGGGTYTHIHSHIHIHTN